MQKSALTAAVLSPDGIDADTGEGWVQVKVPMNARAGQIAVALKGMEVPVILDSEGKLLGVKSGNLYTYTTTDGQHIVWRWRA